MSSTVGWRVVSNSWGFVRRKPVFAVNIAKFSSDEPAKIVIPAPIPGMIQAAVLKKFTEPLVIENIKPPKSPQSNEVRIIFIIYYFIRFI